MIPPRILIVDDEPLISMMVEQWVLELGYEVLGPATNVSEALALIEKAPEISAGVLDVFLKDEDSSRVADALRTRSIPFVLATGYGSHGLPPHLPSALILSKPFEFDDLRQALAVLLANKDHLTDRIEPSH